MKKQILFICSNMGIGGFQKSMLSLLQHFDYSCYEVDLLLFNPTGIFMPFLPKEVNLLPVQIAPEYFYSAFPAVRALWRQKKFFLMLWRILCGAAFMLDRGCGAWLLSRAVPGLDKKYDAAIDYNGQQILYYMADRIKADRKISFFHSDYAKWDYYKLIDRIYFGKMDAVVSVSDECVNSLKKYFPEYAGWMFCIENIISNKTVQSHDNKTFSDDFDGKRLVSVGRVTDLKGVDLAIEACRILKERRADIRWYWIGPCADFSVWQRKVAEYGLEDMFIFLGPQSNPYNYMKQAYLLLHPSRFEGKAVAVEEAKILNLSVVATNYSTVKNQIEDGVNGKITNMTPEAIADGVCYYLEHPEIREQQSRWLAENCTGNAYEAEKLYKLIEGNI